MRRASRWPILVLALLLARGGPAYAADPGARAETPSEAASRLVQTHGWVYRLSTSVNGSLTYNHHVPGIDDGLSVSFGVLFDGSAQLRHDAHRWENGLKLTSGWSKTATQKHLLKNADWAELYTRYGYRFQRWDRRVGLFGGLSLGAALFPGDLVYGEDTDLLYTYVDGAQVTGLAEKNRRLRITTALTPLVFKQLVGAQARPYDSPFAHLDLHLGLVGLEVWADGFTLDDDRDTPEKELRQLQDYQQTGLQLEVALAGELKKHLTYSFRAELMVPFVTSVPTPVRGFNLMNLDLGFKIGLKLGRWASLDFVFGAKRFPMLVTGWQITNQLVLSVTINI